MDLAANLPVVLQDCCLGLGASPPSVLTPALTVAALENPGMHRLMFPALVMDLGRGDPSNTHCGASFL